MPTWYFVMASARAKMHWDGICGKRWRRWREKARAFDDLDSLADSVAALARSGDHILVMSNGGFGGVHQKILDRLSRK